MKTTWIVICAACSGMVLGPVQAFADHDKDCKATHGTVSAKTDRSVTVAGKTYALNDSTKIVREEGARAGIASVNVGDKVCVETTSAEGRQAAKLVMLDRTERDRTYAREKMSELDRASHEKACKGHHGKVTAKGSQSVTLDGKRYAFAADTRMIKGGKPVPLQGVQVGDVVCFQTQKAADGTRQITKLTVIDDYERARVRGKIDDRKDVDVEEKDNDVNKDIDIETPDKESK